ncbi:MAG TPA: PqqD family protein [Marinilabiliaceae bacterium]|nr:PqqD family protein [Marinilabiliaceae bacterium]
MNFKQVYRVVNESFVIRKVQEEMVLVPLVNNVADMTSVITLNDTAASIIEHLDGIKTLDAVILQLLATYNVNKELLKKDVTIFVTDALSKGIIEPIA